MSKVDQIFVRVRPNRERTQFVDLRDGFRLGIKTQWIHQAQIWAMWIVTTAGAQVHGPIALVKGVNLVRPYQWDTDNVPKGQLWVSGQPMTLDNADLTSRLYYRPAS